MSHVILNQQYREKKRVNQRRQLRQLQQALEYEKTMCREFAARIGSLHDYAATLRKEMDVLRKLIPWWRK